MSRADRLAPKKRAEAWIEAQLRRAVEEGDFASLPGAGKPIADIDEPYDPDWWLKGERLSVVPRAVEIRLEVERALEAWRSRDEPELRRRLEPLNAKIRRWNATVVSGPATTVAGVDVEAAVARWLAGRSGSTRLRFDIQPKSVIYGLISAGELNRCRTMLSLIPPTIVEYLKDLGNTIFPIA